MQPVLTVEGKTQDVWKVEWRDGKPIAVEIWDGTSIKRYHDAKENLDYYIEKPLQVDFDTQLNWQGQHDGVVKALDKRIEAHEERLIELSRDFIGIYVNGDVPFPEIEAKSIQEEYRILQYNLEGLYEAKRIILVEHKPLFEEFLEGVKKLGKLDF